MSIERPFKELHLGMLIRLSWAMLPFSPTLAFCLRRKCFEENLYRRLTKLCAEELIPEHIGDELEKKDQRITGCVALIALAYLKDIKRRVRNKRRQYRRRKAARRTARLPDDDIPNFDKCCLTQRICRRFDNRGAKRGERHASRSDDSI